MKPFTLSELAFRVRRVLDQAQAAYHFLATIPCHCRFGADTPLTKGSKITLQAALSVTIDKKAILSDIWVDTWIVKV
jgi:DNA-binding response OmpR family regulator